MKIYIEIMEEKAHENIDEKNVEEKKKRPKEVDWPKFLLKTN